MLGYFSPLCLGYVTLEDVYIIEGGLTFVAWVLCYHILLIKENTLLYSVGE